MKFFYLFQLSIKASESRKTNLVSYSSRSLDQRIDRASRVTRAATDSDFIFVITSSNNLTERLR